MKFYYDQKAKDLKPLGEGDTVVMKPMRLGRKEWTKGTVVRGAGRSYDVETEEGAVLRRNRVHLKKVPDPPIPESSPPPPPVQAPEETQQQKLLQTPAVQPTPTAEVRTRSGRLVKSNQAENFVY